MTPFNAVFPIMFFSPDLIAGNWGGVDCMALTNPLYHTAPMKEQPHISWKVLWSIKQQFIDRYHHVV